MMDLARKDGEEINLRSLSDSFGVPVIGVSATKREGLDELVVTLAATIAASSPKSALTITYSAQVEAAVAQIEPLVREWLGAIG